MQKIGLGVGITALVAVIGYLAPTLKKTKIELTQERTKVAQLETKLVTTSIDLEKYKKLYNQDLEIVKEPVFGPQGQVAYRTRYVKRTQIVIEDEKLKQENSILTTRLTSLENEFSAYKKTITIKRNKGMVGFGMAPKTSLNTNIDGLVEAKVNVFGSLWLGVTPTFAYSLRNISMDALYITTDINF